MKKTYSGIDLTRWDVLKLQTVLNNMTTDNTHLVHSAIAVVFVKNKILKLENDSIKIRVETDKLMTMLKEIAVVKDPEVLLLLINKYRIFLSPNTDLDFSDLSVENVLGLKTIDYSVLEKSVNYSDGNKKVYQDVITAMRNFINNSLSD